MTNIIKLEKIVKKRKPLQKTTELIIHFKQILLVLLPSPGNKNYIFMMVSQTGLPGMKFKKSVLVAIDYLQEAGLIRDISPSKEYPNSKQVKQLTHLGREVAELLDNVEEYYKSFSELTDGIKRNFSILPQKTMQEGDKKTINIIMQNKGIPNKVKCYRTNQKEEKLIRTGEEYYDPVEYYHKLSFEANKLRAWTSPAKLFI